MGLIVRACLRLLQRFGMKNVYVRRFFLVFAFLRWLSRRKRDTTQIVRLRKGETLTISIDKSEAQYS